jgi:hypothetical protein
MVDTAGAPMGVQATLKNPGGNRGQQLVHHRVQPGGCERSVRDPRHSSSASTLEVTPEGYTTVTQAVTLAAPDRVDAGSVTLTAAALLLP